jgi:hypothetical protein
VFDDLTKDDRVEFVLIQLDAERIGDAQLDPRAHGRRFRAQQIACRCDRCGLDVDAEHLMTRTGQQERQDPLAATDVENARSLHARHHPVHAVPRPLLCDGRSPPTQISLGNPIALGRIRRGGPQAPPIFDRGRFGVAPIDGF